jgi:high affinity sulfate transporter 1
MATYSAYAVTLVLVVGCVYLVAGVARLGWVTQFLSKPVMDGFVTGLAIFIAVGQLNKLFGVEKGTGNVFQKFFTIIRELPEANWVTFAVGAASLALLFLLPRWNKRIPAGLVVLFGSIAVSLAFNLSANFGVVVVGTLPQGLPSIALPTVPLETAFEMILPAMAIFLVGFSEALGAGREFAEKHHQEIDPNQELNAHALANLASALCGGMIAGGGMSGTAVQEGAGARTQVANLITWGATVVTLLLLTPLFASLPEAVLAALIIHAIWHIIASRKLEKIRLVSRVEWGLAALALLGVLFIGVSQGMIIGLVASVLLVLYKSSRPHLSSLGRVPGIPGAYSDLKRHPENDAVPGVLILRLDEPLYYANAQTVRDRIKALIAETQPPPHVLLWDSTGQDMLDITSAEVLKRLVVELKAKGMDFYVAEMHAPVREQSQRTGLLELIGEDHIFPTVEIAVRFIETSAGSGWAGPGEKPKSGNDRLPVEPV